MAKDDDVKITTPRHVLREKIGFGGVEAARLVKVQQSMDNTKVEFEVYGLDFLDRIERYSKDAKLRNALDRSALMKIINPVMDMKANGGMFKYKLLSEIADILLNFLEDLPALNTDAFDVIDAHTKTMRAIILGKLSGDGGKTGRMLADELYRATRRYYKKHGNT